MELFFPFLVTSKIPPSYESWTGNGVLVNDGEKLGVAGGIGETNQISQHAAVYSFPNETSNVTSVNSSCILSQ